jgi:hypothetical protein
VQVCELHRKLLVDRDCVRFHARIIAPREHLICHAHRIPVRRPRSSSA